MPTPLIEHLTSLYQKRDETASTESTASETDVVRLLRLFAEFIVFLLRSCNIKENIYVYESTPGHYQLVSEGTVLPKTRLQLTLHNVLKAFLLLLYKTDNSDNTDNMELSKAKGLVANLISIIIRNRADKSSNDLLHEIKISIINNFPCTAGDRKRKNATHVSGVSDVPSITVSQKRTPHPPHHTMSSLRSPLSDRILVQP